MRHLSMDSLIVLAVAAWGWPEGGKCSAMQQEGLWQRRVPLVRQDFPRVTDRQDISPRSASGGLVPKPGEPSRGT